MSVIHIAASNNDIQMLDFFLESTTNPENDEQCPLVDIRNNENWTPAHFASFLNNFDALNLLLQYGADLCAKHNGQLKVYEEMVRADNADLLECVYRPWVENDQKKRDLYEMGSFGLMHLASTND